MTRVGSVRTIPKESMASTISSMVWREMIGSGRNGEVGEDGGRTRG